eukprot:105853-Amphidinium_carterae.1
MPDGPPPGLPLARSPLTLSNMRTPASAYSATPTLDAKSYAKLHGVHSHTLRMAATKRIKKKAQEYEEHELWRHDPCPSCHFCRSKLQQQIGPRTSLSTVCVSTKPLTLPQSTALEHVSSVGGAPLEALVQPSASWVGQHAPSSVLPSRAGRECQLAKSCARPAAAG